MNYFSSDSHFWHNNVIKYCNRPFSSIEEMNETLVNNWNSVVKPDDIVTYLGDFSLAFRAVETFSHRLNGFKWLVPGNHDFCHSYHKKSRSQENKDKWIQKYADHGWAVMPEINQGLIGDHYFKLCHHPYATEYELEKGDKYAKWRPEDKGAVLLCGHVHEKWKTKRSPKGTLMINVGVDQWDYKPVSMDQILQLIEEENGKQK